MLSANHRDATLLNTTQGRVRPTQAAATALLARTASIYHLGSWDSAVQRSTVMINNTGMFSLTGLDSTFLMNNTEAIWQLQPVTTGITNTYDAYEFIIPSTGPNAVQTVYLSNGLLSSFEPNDGRRTAWVDSISLLGGTYYYPYKYKENAQNAAVSEYLTALRLAEQYLIRAEAYADLNQLPAALTDLNTIRSRAGLPPVVTASQSTLLAAIQHERQIEFFSEFGHRWLDLKRTSTVDQVMGTNGACAAKGGTWNSFQQWYPLPPNDLLRDPALKQNSGY